jgi:hypothetical protein
MSRKMMSLSALLITLLLVTGCIGRLQVGPTQTDSETVELGTAESARVDINMGLGKVNVDNGASELMEADFTYNVEAWKPEVDYRLSGSEGRLTVKQPDTNLDLDSIPDENVEYEWDVKLNNDIPIDLNLNLGVGEGYLELSGLLLRSLDIQTGVGEATIDLSGDWDESFDVDIKGGVGRTTILLPRDVGVRANTQTGIGSVNVHGLIRNGDTYTNQAYEEGGVVLDINVEGGVGAIDLELGD